MKTVRSIDWSQRLPVEGERHRLARSRRAGGRVVSEKGDGIANLARQWQLTSRRSQDVRPPADFDLLQNERLGRLAFRVRTHGQLIHACGGVSRNYQIMPAAHDVARLPTAGGGLIAGRRCLTLKNRLALGGSKLDDDHGVGDWRGPGLPIQ